MKVETLRARRVKLRYSQYFIAKIAGLSRNRLSLIESHYVDPTIEEIAKIQGAIDKVEKERRRWLNVKKRLSK